MHLDAFGEIFSGPPRVELSLAYRRDVAENLMIHRAQPVGLLIAMGAANGFGNLSESSERRLSGAGTLGFLFKKRSF